MKLSDISKTNFIKKLLILLMIASQPLALVGIVTITTTDSIDLIRIIIDSGNYRNQNMAKQSLLVGQPFAMKSLGYSSANELNVEMEKTKNSLEEFSKSSHSKAVRNVTVNYLTFWLIISNFFMFLYVIFSWSEKTRSEIPAAVKFET